MSMKMTMAEFVGLEPCPFCSAEPEILNDGRRTWGLVQHNDGCLFPTHPKHEIPESDFVAWNNRAPLEYDGWFYLPKPKEGIVDYGEPAITRTENGYKVRQIVDVVDEAARKWGDDLGEYIMRRICEIWNSRADYHGYEQAAIEAWKNIKAWNSRAERTCKMETDHDELEVIAYSHEDTWAYKCSACDWSFRYDRGIKPNYCPNCGRKCI